MFCKESHVPFFIWVWSTKIVLRRKFACHIQLQQNCVQRDVQKYNFTSSNICTTYSMLLFSSSVTLGTQSLSLLVLTVVHGSFQILFMFSNEGQSSNDMHINWIGSPLLRFSCSCLWFQAIMEICLVECPGFWALVLCTPHS